MRKNILSENNLRYSGSFPHAEDYEFWIRCSRHTSFSNVNKILLSYRLHPTKVGIRHKEVQEDSINRARESLLAELNISPSREEKLLHNNLGNWNFQDSEGFLLDTQKWLLKLKEANMNAKVFPEPAFSYVLFEKMVQRLLSNKIIRHGEMEDLFDIPIVPVPYVRLHRHQTLSHQTSGPYTRYAQGKIIPVNSLKSYMTKALIGIRGALRSLSFRQREQEYKKKDIVACIFSVGERSESLAIESVRDQDLPVKRIEVIRDVTPMHAAFNRMFDVAHDADYILCVDADMVLHKNCTRTAAPCLPGYPLLHSPAHGSCTRHGRIHKAFEHVSCQEIGYTVQGCHGV